MVASIYDTNIPDETETELVSWLRIFYAAERVIAFIALLILAPLALIIAAAIVILSRRGPLVSHARVGWRGAPLPMLKFRTMWDRAEVPLHSLATEKVSGNVPCSKGAADVRIRSRFALFCRRHSLDELPQLYHVARGEMSLVGPRPITRGELQEHYGDCAGSVLSLRPGITGLWQISGRNELTYAERRHLDLLLVNRASPGLFLGILVRSIPAVLTGRGSY